MTAGTPRSDSSPQQDAGAGEALNQKPIRILVVCRWPLGGIRTYLAYLYSGISHEDLSVTFLVCRTAEVGLLERELNPDGHRIVMTRRYFGREVLAFEIARLLLSQKFAVIHSQGFISACHVASVNWFFRRRHVLTIHGILERRYISGNFLPLRRMLLRLMQRDVTVFHAVGNDIMNEVRRALEPTPRQDRQWLMIPNGVDVDRIRSTLRASRRDLLSSTQIPDTAFLFGFFGRFMPQKGFLSIVEAVARMTAKSPEQVFVVLAYGSGDYEREYRGVVSRRGLERSIRFMPHRADPIPAMMACDAVLMPSTWEAWSLVASEALCSGVPLIASDCVGLREVTAGTPAIVIPANNIDALTEAMATVIADPDARPRAEAYAEAACQRFDVRATRSRMLALFRSLATEFAHITDPL